MMRAAFILCALLAACGPMSVQQAERECFQRARLAAAPRGEVGVGVGSDGSSSGSVEVSISTDYLLNRDPSAIYETCVMSKSGQAPSRPLYQRPDWKG